MRRARLSRFRERAGAVFIALVLAAPACSDDIRAPAATPLGVPAAPVACTTLSDNCALPLPTNLFTRPADTATGLTLDLHAETFTSAATTSRS